jgi:hypothetical protein
MCIGSNILLNYKIIFTEGKVHMNLDGKALNIFNIAPIIAAVLLFVFQLYWCRGALNSEEKRKQYVNAFGELKKRWSEC